MTDAAATAATPTARTLLDLGELREATAAGAGFEYVFFLDYGSSRTDRVSSACLSQWWPSPFRADGRDFLTAEQYMMYRKARLFGDDASADAILGARTPFQAQLLGRKVAGYREEIWREHRSSIVADAGELKFRQNPALRDYLVSTGASVLVEASTTDLVWGAGVSEDDPFARIPRRWSGQNLLGFSLMAARDRILGLEHGRSDTAPEAIAIE